MEKYLKLNFKIPKESEDYLECSEFVVNSINEIIRVAITNRRNKIIINTNLKLGLPMENINKIAGPFVEAWAYEIFADILEDKNNKYDLINIEAGERLNISDIILQFKKNRKNQSSVTADVDVKATSNDIDNSRKSPNITSFAKIRTAYIHNSDFIFIILSLKHKVFSKKDSSSNMMMGVMEIVDYCTYDLKHLSEEDISYNPALGTGQLQIKDIHYISKNLRNVWDFCQLLDKKCIKSKKGFDEWYKYAKQYGWIKNEEY